MSNLDNSVNKNEYEERIEKQAEILKLAFKEIDRNHDDNIDESELFEFLQQRGKNIDRDTLNKLFKTLDFDHNGYISINEFIRSYLKNLSELEVYLQELEKNIQESRDESKKLSNEMEKYKNERLNSEGLSENAHLQVNVSRVEVQDSRNAFENIEVKIVLDNFNQNLKYTKKENLDFVFDQDIKIGVKSRNQKLIFEITDRNNELGKSEVPLSSITNQEEYELDLEITNETNDKEVLLVLRTKVTFIWSFLQKYEEQRNFSIKKAEKSEEMHRKTKVILDNLDKPFNLMSVQLDKVKNNQSSSKPTTSAKEYEYADKIESYIKSSLNLQTIAWLPLIKILLFASIGLAFCNMFARADFINMLIPVYMLALFSTSLSNKLLENLKLFLIVATVTLGTDFLWLFFRSSSNISDGGAEDSIRSLVYFTSLISFIVKVVLVLGLWIQKLKTERGEEN